MAKRMANDANHRNLRAMESPETNGGAIESAAGLRPGSARLMKVASRRSFSAAKLMNP